MILLLGYSASLFLTFVSLALPKIWSISESNASSFKRQPAGQRAFN
jgi:hypothetical protein